MKQVLAIFVCIASLSGCAMFENAVGKPAPDVAQPEPVETADPDTVQTAPVPANARTVEEFDTTSAEQRAAAVSEAERPGGERDLGLTIASLGSPSEPGFWLKTPLVSKPAKGRVDYAATGGTVVVDLIPIEGPRTAGSRMSLAALRLLGAPLTGLPEVRVYQLKQ